MDANNGECNEWVVRSEDIKDVTLSISICALLDIDKYLLHIDISIS